MGPDEEEIKMRRGAGPLGMVIWANVEAGSLEIHGQAQVKYRKTLSSIWNYRGRKIDTTQLCWREKGEEVTVNCENVQPLAKGRRWAGDGCP